MDPVWILAPLAASMALVIAALVRWGSHTRTVVGAAFVVFLFAMMAAMFLGAWVYFVHPSGTSAVLGLWVAGVAMSVSVFPVVAIVVREALRSTESEGAEPLPPRTLSRPWTFVVAVLALVLIGELLMGRSFALAAGSGGGSGSWGSVLAATALSPWFVFPASLEMAAATVLLWKELPTPLRIMLPLQTAAMALTPTTLGSGSWSTMAIVAGSVGMIALIVYAMEHMYRHRELPVALGRYLLALLAAYAAMMVGVVLWLVYGAPDLLAASIVAEMVVYFAAVLANEGFRTGPAFSWQLRPAWTFGVLSLVLVGELFMGAALDLVLQPAVFSGTFFALPLAGPPATLVAHALSDGFWFFAVVAGSTWFLAMMGAEMGVLVVFKLRETRSLETRVRLGLMLGCYAAFAVFFPSVYYTALFPNAPAGAAVPFLGWSMGIGTAPIGPSVFAVLFATYLVTGVLVVLFGRRVICSTFCTAALMYQGTTIDAMKSFNRSSPVGRKYLSSRFSTAFSVTTSVTMGALVVASFASYFDVAGRLDWTIGGTDPTVFLFALSFGVLWYVMFVTIPYTGNYNCVTMGWCYTGQIAAAFQNISFFKLKVRSKDVCKACTTLDCAKGCPVGLVDMPGHFRTKGEFRSTKCCGVGDCVESCPFGNLYVADVRHWVRRRLGRSEPRYDPGQLPMLRPTVTSVRASSRASPAVTALPAGTAVSRLGP